MLLFNARTNDRGFSMFEIAIVLLIVGILAVIAVPSFISMFNKNSVNDALAKVQGILKEAQREAIRKSKTCTVTIPAEGNDKTISSSCNVTGDRTLTGINIDHEKDTDPWLITFDFKGRTNDLDNQGKLILTSANNTTSERKCLALSQGLGIIRTGNYIGINCITSRQ
ncbi:type II secretion system protein [Chroococcidiopsidales cyanobacterium LEGE 13417]|nr:type II secretion system protein [Chroococcidiopsidales cyanobacterium LEGE 13417]